MADEKKLCLKIFVDKEKKRALFGEADIDFIDILFSFLTLPLGKIVKIFSKNSGMQPFDNLYDSIEKLDDQCWWNKACKNMILNPHSAAGEHYKELKLNIYDDPNTIGPYFCKQNGCFSGSTSYYSYVKDTRCNYCGHIMNDVGLLKNYKLIEGDEVFVMKNWTKFIITDDFHVRPLSASQYIDIFKGFGIEDLSIVEERTLDFRREELLNLLKKLLDGKEVLTKLCFPNLCVRSTTNEMKMKNFESQDNTELEIEKFQIILIMNKTNNNVVCVELEDEFANQLFSFLTFPLGSVLKLIGYSNSLGCMPNLYKSIQELNIKCFKSEEEKNMLISPQLPHFFGYNKQILYVEEESQMNIKPIDDCEICERNDMTMCEHGELNFLFKAVNPKLAGKDQNLDGGFVREAEIFLMTDDFHITPLSVFSLDQILKKHGLKVGHVEKREITLGRVEVGALLEAMLFSKTTLNDALLPYI